VLSISSASSGGGPSAVDLSFAAASDRVRCASRRSFCSSDFSFGRSFESSPAWSSASSSSAVSPLFPSWSLEGGGATDPEFEELLSFLNLEIRSSAVSSSSVGLGFSEDLS